MSSLLVLRCAYFRYFQPSLATSAVRLTANSHCITRDFGQIYKKHSLKQISYVKHVHISAGKNFQDNRVEKDNIKEKDIPPVSNKPILNEPLTSSPKLSLFQRFKQMYKDYWYVLIPVHCFTSVFWAGGFYFAVKSGLDVVALLESMSISEKIINPLRNSSVGYYALTYALYKVATPARYAVTLGGTTVTINYLTRWGYIKHVPSTEKLQVLYRARKDEFTVKRESIRRKLRQHRADLKKRMSLNKKRVNK